MPLSLMQVGIFFCLYICPQGETSSVWIGLFYIVQSGVKRYWQYFLWYRKLRAISPIRNASMHTHTTGETHVELVAASSSSVRCFFLHTVQLISILWDVAFSMANFESNFIPKFQITDMHRQILYGNKMPRLDSNGYQVWSQSVSLQDKPIVCLFSR